MRDWDAIIFELPENGEQDAAPGHRLVIADSEVTI